MEASSSSTKTHFVGGGGETHLMANCAYLHDKGERVNSIVCFEKLTMASSGGGSHKIREMISCIRRVNVQIARRMSIFFRDSHCGQNYCKMCLC